MAVPSSTILAGISKEYDEKKIEQLQESLLTALKHATNIRPLAPEDTVTVVVQGRGHALQVSTNQISGFPGAVFGIYRGLDSSGRTV